MPCSQLVYDAGAIAEYEVLTLLLCCALMQPKAMYPVEAAECKPYELRQNRTPTKRLNDFSRFSSDDEPNQQTETNLDMPSKDLGCPAAHHNPSQGPSARYQMMSNPGSPDTPVNINNYSAQRLAGSKQSSPEAGAADATTVQDDAFYYRLAAAAVAAIPAAPVSAPYDPVREGLSIFAASAAVKHPASQPLGDTSTAAASQRTCTNCGTDHCPAKTWRAGPAGPQTLCNRCGIRYRRHGAASFTPGSVAANAAAAAELAAEPQDDAPAAQPTLSRISSARNNYAAKPEGSADDATAPISSSTSHSGALVQANHSGAAQQILQGSRARQGQRQKRSRGLESDDYVPSGASGRRAAADDAAEGEMHSEAAQLLATVAPGDRRVRKSSRVAEQRVKQGEAVKAATYAADELTEAAETLLQMAGCCWVDGLAGVLGGELDSL